MRVMVKFDEEFYHGTVIEAGCTNAEAAVIIHFDDDDEMSLLYDDRRTSVKIQWPSANVSFYAWETRLSPCLSRKNI